MIDSPEHHHKQARLSVISACQNLEDYLRRGGVGNRNWVLAHIQTPLVEAAGHLLGKHPGEDASQVFGDWSETYRHNESRPWSETLDRLKAYDDVTDDDPQKAYRFVIDVLAKAWPPPQRAGA